MESVQDRATMNAKRKGANNECKAAPHQVYIPDGKNGKDGQVKQRLNTKAKGTRLEKKTIEWLELRGYKCQRSAGSRGVWDVLAIGPHDIRAIQVKANHWPSTKEMERMEQFPAPIAVIKEVWRWDDYAKEPSVRPVARCRSLNYIPIMEPDRVD